MARFWKAVWKTISLLAKGVYWTAIHLFNALRSLLLASWKMVRKTRKEDIKATYSEIEVIECMQGEFSEFEERVMNSKSVVGVILGARGSGKSALGMRLLENARAKGRRVQALGFNPSSLPEWIECIDSIEQVKNNSFLLVDEGGITFSARSFTSSANKLLSQLLLVSRHKDLSVLFISQNSANIDINALRQADYLILKKSSLLQLDFERKKIKEIYEKSVSGFSKHSGKEGLAFVYSDEFTGFISNKLPGFWSEKASKSFGNFTVK